MFVDVASDIFRQIVMHDDETSIDGFLKENVVLLQRLIEYFNESLQKIGTMYKCVYPGISKEYSFQNNIVTWNYKNN